MKTVDLRNTIIEYTKTADDKLLTIVKAVFEKYKKNETDFFDELPKEIQEILLESQTDVKNGNFLRNAEVQTKVNEKYNILTR